MDESLHIKIACNAGIFQHYSATLWPHLFCVIKTTLTLKLLKIHLLKYDRPCTSHRGQ